MYPVVQNRTCVGIFQLIFFPRTKKLGPLGRACRVPDIYRQAIRARKSERECAAPRIRATYVLYLCHSYFFFFLFNSFSLYSFPCGFPSFSSPSLTKEEPESPYRARHERALVLTRSRARINQRRPIINELRPCRRVCIKTRLFVTRALRSRGPPKRAARSLRNYLRRQTVAASPFLAAEQRLC